MRPLIRSLLISACLLAPGQALWAQAAATPPADFVAPELPKAEDNNAERAKSQPGNNAPFWRAVRESGVQEGSSSLPGAEKGVLIQSFTQYPGSLRTNAGDAWRQVRNRWILPYGGALLLVAVGAVALFYWRRGTLGGHLADTGRRVERFTPFERSAHWANAIAFVILAVSGLVMAFGKFTLLPVIGSTLFGWLTYALKTAHNFAGPLFAVSLVIVLVTFVRDNLPPRASQASSAARKCRRTASTPARSSSSGAACSRSGGWSSAAVWCSTRSFRRSTTRAPRCRWRT